MMNKVFLLSFFKKYKFVAFISLFLFIVPFFWLKPGEMDLGGDGNRLFFYDPITYLKSTNIYGIRIEGMGTVEPRYYEIPYIGLIALLKFFISSPTFVISTINGLKLAGGFIAIYLIAYEFTRQVYSGNSKYTYIAAILAGIFYVVSLGSFYMAYFWDRALTEHNQVFLNPIIFYLLFKFFLTNTYRYLWITLLVSFIFAPNFSYGAAPPFFAFYPLGFLFLFMYIKMFRKKPIPWKGVGIGFLLFLGIQSFHLLSQFFNLLDSGSAIHNRVFSKSEAEKEGLSYFLAIRDHGMASLNLLLPSENAFLRWISFVAPLIVIVGSILNKKKEFLFISLFFILTFFLVTANITNIGLELYKSLFHIPVFSMFRNFYTQWLPAFIFFYSLLFGIATCTILLRLKPLYGKVFFFCVSILLVITGIPLFLGWPVNKNIIRGSDNLKVTFKMDPQIEQTLQFIRSLPDDGKFLVMPLTDFNSQLVYGKDGGAYEGPSTLRHLTYKYGFYGDRSLGWHSSEPVQYTEIIKKYAREKNYSRLLRIFITLNIRYIFHNADPRIYEKSFPVHGPYEYIKTSLPNTQQGYADFIAHFPFHLIYTNGPFHIYEINKSAYNPTIFIPDSIYQNDMLSFDADREHAVFIKEDVCKVQEFKNLCKERYKAPPVELSFNMMNPTLYKVMVRTNGPIDKMLLVMQHTFHKGWKLVIDNKIIAEDRHIPVNGYANGWLLTGKDIPKSETYTVFIKLDQQKYFWYGWALTSVSLVIIIGFLISSFVKNKKTIIT